MLNGVLVTIPGLINTASVDQFSNFRKELSSAIPFLPHRLFISGGSCIVRLFPNPVGAWKMVFDD